VVCSGDKGIFGDLFVFHGSASLIRVDSERKVRLDSIRNAFAFDRVPQP